MPSRQPPSSGDRGNRRLRLLDRWLGVPLVFLLGLLRRRRPPPQTVTRIGFLLLGAIGDSLLAATVIAALRRAYPQARIVCFVNDSNRALGDFITGVDSLISLPLKSPLRALRMIREHHPDVLVDFGPWPRISAVLAALGGAGFTIGFRTAGQGRHFAYDVAVQHSAARHEIENFHALATPLTGAPTTGRPQLAAPQGAPVLPQGRRWILFHPWPAGYRHEWRAWPQEGWIALAHAIQGWGYGIAISGGPGDRAESDALAAAIGTDVLVLAGRASLRDTIQALAEADAVVAVNTGVMHLAAALDRPMVALHGPTDPRRWGPLSDRAVAIGPGSEKGCAYLNLGFEYPANPPDCMGCITVAEVTATLRRLLER